MLSLLQYSPKPGLEGYPNPNYISSSSEHNKYLAQT